ncbi:MAG: putative amidohydrolase [Verrucomicrobiales bacterium]|jgi:predicted amidohydrolase
MPQLNIYLDEATHESVIAAAKINKANVVLLPEVMDLGWTHPSAKEYAEPIPNGKTCRRFCESAKENNVYICAGIVERDGDAIYNSAVIIDNKGNVLIKHRKLNELSVWIASASNVGPITAGPWKNWNTIGCSLLIGPDGKEKLMGPYGKKAEKILYHTIKPTPRPARGTNWTKFKPDN